MNIERKILLLVLGVGVLWAFLLGGLSYSGITQVQRSTEDKGDEMLAAFDAFIENYAESLVKERIEQAQFTALQVTKKLCVFYDAENIAKMAEKILEHPQNYSPRYLPEATERTINANNAYIYYNPGVREQLATNPDLAKKFALLSNIANSLEYVSYFYRSGDVCFLASKDGCLIRAYAVSKGQTTLTLNEAAVLRSYDFRESPWYVAAKQANGLVFTDVYESTAGDLEIGSVMPFYDHGEFAGVVGISITLKSLHLTANENDISFIL
ncbi:MAG: PDC sensor domain-containing protein, partial [Selenomonadaceae bacterium]|nr:PDC sensor domain-containing protein [Selenomonadaceae bacterium]